MSKELLWYWSRLKCMSPSEISYRAKKSVYMQAQKSGYFLANDVPTPDVSVHGRQFIGESCGIPKERYCRAAANVIAGKISIFAIDDAVLGSLPIWNRDPLSGTLAPSVFGKSLNYRDSDLVGDIKYLWEPNRHLQLVVLAQAFSLTREEHYLEALRSQLDSWFDQCPYMIGPNWTSSLELGIRLINWSLVWQLIGGHDSIIFQGRGGDEFRKRWLESIYQHAHFIAGHLSLYSSANNHLIGEASGLFIAAVVWPYWKICKNWSSRAQKILEREALVQNAADGVNREQAISYQQFVLDFLIITALAGKENNLTFSSDYWNRIELMLEYLASIMDVHGNVPMIGDADDGYVVNLSREKDWCPYRSLLATGAVLFKRGDFKAKAGYLDEKSIWLIGSGADLQFKKISTDALNLPVHRVFPDGGYYILGSNFETEDEIRLVVDAGPMGYQSIAAHGHADALAITLSIGGIEFLVDPGTYAYHTQKKWRDYFRGTSAHNTICVDGLDQSVSGGNFMWLRKAITSCEIWEPGDEVDHFVGKHDGYSRLTDAVAHRREITLRKKDRVIIITDTLSCKGAHKIECIWNFSEDCQVVATGNQIDILNAGKRMTLTLVDSIDRSDSVLINGDESRPMAWVSRRYDVKVPTTVAVWSMDINGTSTIRTEIQCE